MSDEDRDRVEQAKRLIREALSGTSPKSKSTLLREAEKALSAIK